MQIYLDNVFTHNGVGIPKTSFVLPKRKFMDTTVDVLCTSTPSGNIGDRCIGLYCSECLLNSKKSLQSNYETVTENFLN